MERTLAAEFPAVSQEPLYPLALLCKRKEKQKNLDPAASLRISGKVRKLQPAISF